LLYLEKVTGYKSQGSPFENFVEKDTDMIFSAIGFFS